VLKCVAPPQQCSRLSDRWALDQIVLHSRLKPLPYQGEVPRDSGAPESYG